MNQKREYEEKKKKKREYEETHTRAMEKRKHGTHQPFDGDAPHDPGFWQRDGPTAAFWPNPSIARGWFAGTGRADIRGPSGGGGGSLTYQTGSRAARKQHWGALGSPLF